MTKLDFDGARAELEEQVLAPDFAAIRRDGRRRRTRRRTTAGAVGVAAVCAAVLITVTGNLPGRPDRDAPPADGLPLHGPLAGEKVSLIGGERVETFRPLDPKRAFAVLRTRDNKPALAQTVDAGKVWQAWLLPKAVALATPAPDDSRGNADPVVPQILDLQTVELSGYITRDGGGTWSKMGPGKEKPASETSDQGSWGLPVFDVWGSSLSEAPAGWPVFNRCLSTECYFDVVDPTSGVRHVLTARPPGKVDGPVIRARDGSLWTGFHDSFDPMAMGRSGIAVSRDSGRTWVNVLSPFDAGPNGLWMDTYDGTTAYAIANDNQLLVTTDGGRHWTRGRAGGGLSFQTVMATTRGNVLAVNDWTPSLGSESGQLVLSRDGGKTFKRLGYKLANIERTFTGFVGRSVVDEKVDGRAAGYHVSFDGEVWYKAPSLPGR